MQYRQRGIGSRPENGSARREIEHWNHPKFDSGREENHNAVSNLAITVGCYALTSFVELNVLRCRHLIPEVPILLSDDRSDASKDIQALAVKYDCDYVCPKKRRSHFSGDWNHIINSLVFAKEIGATVAVKLSQRCIPVLPGFFVALDRTFKDPEVQIAHPGQLNPNQIVRKASTFFKRFGCLSDMLAFRVGAIEPEELLSIYRMRNNTGRAHDSFSETSIGFLLASRFPGNKARMIPEWTNHQQGMPKLFLRKAQSPSSDYVQIARMHGINADASMYDCREWREIQGSQYRPKADIT